MILSKPKNQMAHVLYDLAAGRMISEREYVYNRFRGIISDLRLHFDLPIRHQDVPNTNQFGRKSYYRKHYLLSIHTKKAIKLYKKINK